MALGTPSESPAVVVKEIDLTESSAWWLAAACGLSLVAHGWAGWVWHWLLQAWRLPLGGLWAIRVYLFTNVAKYLPGNIWHFFGRVRAVQGAGSPLGKSLASAAAPSGHSGFLPCGLLP